MNILYITIQILTKPKFYKVCKTDRKLMLKLLTLTHIGHSDAEQLCNNLQLICSMFKFKIMRSGIVVCLVKLQNVNAEPCTVFFFLLFLLQYLHEAS